MFKKIILSIIFVAIATVAFALTSPSSTTALNSSTYVAINLTSGDGCYNVKYYAEDGGEFVSFYIANDDEGTNAQLIIVPISEIVCVRGGIAFYAKSLTGTPNLVIKAGIK